MAPRLTHSWAHSIPGMLKNIKNMLNYKTKAHKYFNGVYIYFLNKHMMPITLCELKQQQCNWVKMTMKI